MSRHIVDGYPDYLIRVDHAKKTIYVTAECVHDKDAKTVSLPNKYGSEDDWVPFPAKNEVCSNCGGTGTHVNRAIDGNGLSTEDFDEDPDFKEAYFSGAYDVPCDECQGNKVVLVPSTEEGQKAVDYVMEGYYQSRAEEAAERRMGA